MSFANEWLKYLEDRKGDWIRYFVIRGNRPEDMPHTEITVTGEEVKQIYFIHRKGMKIPDKVGIDFVDTESVEVETSDGFTFLISKSKKDEKPTIKLKYADYSGTGVSFEKERVFIREAKRLGYNVVDFHISDV